MLEVNPWGFDPKYRPWTKPDQLTYITYDQFLQDILAFDEKIPEVDAFVGIPRSGLIPATILALQRNVRLTPLQLLYNQPVNCIFKTKLRSNNPAVKRRPKHIQGRICIIDDCCSAEMSTMNEVKRKIANLDCPLKIIYASVYRAAKTCNIDYYHRQVPQPRMFQWNFFRHFNMHYTMWDMDGAICEDWTKKEADDVEAYAKFVQEAKPKVIPEHPILAVVTNRLPRWSTHTKKWLEHHEVLPHRLVMSPYKDTTQRDAKDKPRGSYKARVYKDSCACLFVESDVRQARVIANGSGKVVLTLDENRLVLPGE